MSISKGTKIENTQINEKINYTDALSLEEIQASTDLTGKIVSASALKSLNNILSGFSVLKAKYGYEDGFDFNDLSSYPEGVGILSYTMFTTNSKGSKPFTDGHLLSFIWRNKKNVSDNYISQLAIEDDQSVIKHRAYSANAWSSWKTISIS